MTHLSQTDNSSQITDWWQEAEKSIHAGHFSRARRFLRWIVACCPEEEEGWLVLARLVGNLQEQVPLLRHAYRFHPHSQRVQAALREARRRQLELAVGELKPRGPIPHCLPDARQLSRRSEAAAGNGHAPGPNHTSGEVAADAHPLQADDSDLPWLLAPLSRLLQRQPAPPANGRSNGQGQNSTPRREEKPY